VPLTEDAGRHPWPRPIGGATLQGVTRTPPIEHTAPTAEGTTTVRVMIVDDHAAVREGISAMLRSEPNLEVVATSATAREAITLAQRTRPDVIVLDYHLPDQDGLSLCLSVKSAAPAPAALIYSAFADEHLLPLAIIAGADALISKAADPDELCDVVRTLAGGAAHLPATAPAAMESAASRLDSEDLPILGMLAHRTPPAEIASTLQIAESWLATRRWAMLARLTGGSTRRTSPRHHPPRR
jgi:DNA-binding NarL/FixJ family response regulator